MSTIKKPSVSILTIANLEQIDLIKILYLSLEKQTYNNIREWIILDNSLTTEDFNCSKILLNEFFDSKKSKWNINHTSVQNINSYGSIKNYANTIALGDILVWSYIYDYQFPSHVTTIVDKLTKSNKLLTGSPNIYTYNPANKLIRKMINNNSLLLETLAYKKEYLDIHSFADTNNPAELLMGFTNNLSEPFETVLPENSIIRFYNINKTLEFNKNIKWEQMENDTIKYLMQTRVYEEINKNSLFNVDNEIPSEYLAWDIVYLLGANGIEWEPSDLKLGGSEQAVVNLSSEWATNGYKVIVYGNFKQDYEYNNVQYTNWMNLDTTKKIKNLIVWRTQGIILLMNFDYNADNIIVDFHDNFSYTLAHLDRPQLLLALEKVNKYAFKSNYHLACFEEFIGRKLNNEEYSIILNGVRVEQFKNNQILNDNKVLERNPYRFCYCSSYDRGLEHILENIWPHIYKAEPRAEFHVYYGMDYIFDDTYKNRMKLLLGQPGVMDHGRQSMEMVIREKYLSTFHIYLSNSVAEIDCISIRESLVTGCIPILSKFGVFVERHGLQYDWDPTNKQLCEAIAKNIVKEMNNSNFTKSAREQLMNSGTIISWKDVASNWLNIINKKQEKSWFYKICEQINVKKPDIFVETGTYFGNGIQLVKNDFNEIHSIELNEKFYYKAKKRFENNNKIKIHLGDSAEVLDKLINNFDCPVLFYLDAHYSGGETSFGKEDDKGCPVLRELEILGKRKQKDIIIIDDMRLMGKKSWGGIEGDNVYPLTLYDFEHVTINSIKSSFGKDVKIHQCSDFDRIVLIPN